MINFVLDFFNIYIYIYEIDYTNYDEKRKNKIKKET